MRDWRERLGKVIEKMGWECGNCGNTGEEGIGFTSVVPLHNFIETLLQQEREKARQEVVEEIIEKEKKIWGVSSTVSDGAYIFDGKKYINFEKYMRDKYLSNKGEKK